MKTAIAALAMLCFVTSACLAAPVRARQTARVVGGARVRRVSELKQMSFPRTAVGVLSAGSLPQGTSGSGTSGSGSGGANGTTAYSTGTGVILRPAQLLDSATGSYLELRSLLFDKELLSQLQAKAQDITAKIVFIDESTAKMPTYLFSAYFASLQPGMHTYVLTLGFQAANLNSHFRLTIGDQEIKPDALVVNDVTDNVCALFTYNAGAAPYNNYLNVFADWRSEPGQGTVWRTMYFRYMQLAQIN
jgi:hypothetical protein